MNRHRVSDREQAGLRGPVRTCMDFNGNESEPMSGAEYTVDGKLLSWNWRTSPNSRAETVYSYDDSGRLTGAAHHGGVEYRDEIQYDDQGRKTQVRTVPPRPEREKVATSVTVMFDVMKEDGQLIGGGTITTHHNQNDEPMESLVRDAHGELLARIVHEYDTEGRLVRDSLVRESFEIPEALRSKMPPDQHLMIRKRMKDALALDRLGGFKSAERSYVYDQHGRLAERHLTVGSLHQDETFTYNEHGDVVRHVTLQSGTPFPDRPLNAERLALEHEHAYKYDDRDNWIERNGRTLCNGESRGEGTTRRALTYY